MKLPFRRRPRLRVDIDPTQLAALHHILRFGPTSTSDLHAAVSAVRPIEREMFDTAMATLVAQDVAGYRYDPATGETDIALTPLGLRLKNRIPATSRSALAIYL